jgi:hypothetical protein
MNRNEIDLAFQLPKVAILKVGGNLSQSAKSGQRSSRAASRLAPQVVPNDVFGRNRFAMNTSTNRIAQSVIFTRNQYVLTTLAASSLE